MKINIKDNVSLQKLILLNGHSYRSFAKKAGVSSSHLIQVVNGSRSPGPRTAKKIHEALGIEFNEIFFIDNGCKSAQNQTA